MCLVLRICASVDMCDVRVDVDHVSEKKGETWVTGWKINWKDGCLVAE